MVVRILFKDKSTLDIERASKVTNASTNIPNDWLYVYRQFDEQGYPYWRIPMKHILCVEVTT